MFRISFLDVDVHSELIQNTLHDFVGTKEGHFLWLLVVIHAEDFPGIAGYIEVLRRRLRIISQDIRCFQNPVHTVGSCFFLLMIPAD